jgi:undecaprenyl-diphosphatase
VPDPSDETTGRRDGPASDPNPGRLVLGRGVLSAAVLLRLAAVAVVLVAVYVVADRLWLDAGPPGMDQRLLDTIAQARTSTGVSVSVLLSRLGDAWVVLVVGLLTVTVAWRAGGRRPLAAFLLLVVLGALLVTAVIKDLTDRARPTGALVDALSFAFPSGHAARAAAVYGLVAWLAWRWATRPVTRGLLVGAAVLMIVATGISRLVLGVHWPTDVLFGWLLGGVWVAAAVRVVGPRPLDTPAVSPG